MHIQVHFLEQAKWHFKYSWPLYNTEAGVLTLTQLKLCVIYGLPSV